MAQGISGSDWIWDAANQRYIHQRTGQVVDMAGGSLTTSNIGLSASALRDPYQDIYKEIVRLSDQNREYTAMRTFLASAYPDVLEQFDVAYAAGKRIGVRNANADTAQTP